MELSETKTALEYLYKELERLRTENTHLKDENFILLHPNLTDEDMLKQHVLDFHIITSDAVEALSIPMLKDMHRYIHYHGAQHSPTERKDGHHVRNTFGIAVSASGKPKS